MMRLTAWDGTSTPPVLIVTGTGWSAQNRGLQYFLGVPWIVDIVFPFWIQCWSEMVAAHNVSHVYLKYWRDSDEAIGQLDSRSG
jgi:hypothetical protein